ncbi:MAG: type III secretion system export apparatus subunit SctS [Methylocystaceae bacterium]|nr:type III secretion system export apparatus subunit SctS [Methylocystaceae bacterium]
MDFDLMSVGDLGRNSIVLILMISLPTMVVTAAIGLLVSLVQTVTSIQEQSVGFTLKVIAMIATIIGTFDWYGSAMIEYFDQIFEYIGN